jgi:hypothetical protein
MRRFEELVLSVLVSAQHGYVPCLIGSRVVENYPLMGFRSKGNDMFIPTFVPTFTPTPIEVFSRRVHRRSLDLLGSIFEEVGTGYVYIETESIEWLETGFEQELVEKMEVS